VSGGVVSAFSWTESAWKCAASTFPALSHERYWMVSEEVTGIEPVYVGLDSVGVDPSVV
jgi:hypothetical protein